LVSLNLQSPQISFSLSIIGLFMLTGCSMETGFDAALNRSGANLKKEKNFGVFDFVKECGIPEDKMDDDNAVMVQQSFTSRPIVIEGTQMNVGFKVSTQAKINISSTKTRATQQVSVNVLSTSANAPSGGGLIGGIIGLFAPGIVKNKANGQAQANSGTTTSDALPQKEWLHLVDGGNPQFEGLLCAAQGGKTMTIQRGSDNVVVQFSPALINAVSPLAPIERLRKEIGEGRRFDIKANVMTGSAGFAQGTVSGTTTVREVDPRLECDGIVKEADIAYEFRHEFAGGAYKVGLSKRQVLYLDTQRKKIVGIINEDDKVDPTLKKALPPVCLISDE
jgi:hypothetical protein